MVAGDFFESVPEGGDAYVLKDIVHDWDDDRAIAILRNCRRVMAPVASRVMWKSEARSPEIVADVPR